MRHSIVLPAALGLAALASAQVAPTATAFGGTVRAGLAVAPAVPIGSDVWGGFQRQAASPVGSAHSTLAHATSPTAITANWQLGCQAITSGTSESVASVRYVFASAQPFVGQLDVQWAPLVNGMGTATLAIDVGDDGTIEAQSQGAIPVAFGPGPLVVRVTVQCTASAGSVSGPFGSSWQWSGSALATFAMRLEANHATTSIEGSACGAPAPVLQASPDLAGGVALRGEFAPSSDFGLLAIGFLPIAAPLPLPPTCTLWVAPELIDVQLPDAQHEVAWSFAVPLAVRPLTLRSQVFGLHAASLQLTASACARTDVQ